MIAIVLGMHKSGTTLVARTLHEGGVDMHTPCSGEYRGCKYEDPEAKAITHSILGSPHFRKSLDLPSMELMDRGDDIKEFLQNRRGDWGFKVPDATLAYPIWKKYLPPHIAIGVRRTTEGLLSHYNRRQPRVSSDRVKAVQSVYDSKIVEYGIPVVWYEDLLRGPETLEDIVGCGLPNCVVSREVSYALPT